MTAKFKQGDRVKRTGPHSAIYDNAYDPNGPERFRESEMGDMGTVDYHSEGVHVDWDKGNGSVIAAGALTLVTDEAEKPRKAPAFEVGMRVRAIRDTETLGVRQILKGEEFKVTAFDSKAPLAPFIMRVEPVSGEWPSRGTHSVSGGPRGVNPEDFEEVKAPTIVERPEKAETESKRVPIAHMSELQAGDVVETPYSRATLHAYVTREVEVPKEPEGPQPGTFGTAIVDGERRHGALDEDGDFVYSYWVEGDDYLESGSLALKGHFEGFQPYDA